MLGECSQGNLIAEHLRHYHRHISAVTLRKQFRVGTTTSRALVALVRPGAAEFPFPSAR
jgi:hypothetical protein